MAITKDQAGRLRTFYLTHARNADGTAVRYQSNGRMQISKTRPDEFRVPIKHGLRDYSYLTHKNAHNFTSEDVTQKEYKPEWFTNDVVSLAQHIRDTRDWSKLPVLGDALMEAGCNDEDILNHCNFGMSKNYWSPPSSWVADIFSNPKIHAKADEPTKLSRLGKPLRYSGGNPSQPPSKFETSRVKPLGKGRFVLFRFIPAKVQSKDRTGKTKIDWVWSHVHPPRQVGLDELQRLGIDPQQTEGPTLYSMVHPSIVAQLEGRRTDVMPSGSSAPAGKFKTLPPNRFAR